IYDYDPQTDELNMTFGNSQPSIGQEINDEFFVQLDPKTKEVVGFTVLGFTKRLLAKKEKTEFHKLAVPIMLKGQMQLAR
ncbi:hypothetical protein KKD19_06455, partial [Patescibacteria group bacterium]|nr:hypothetical protein [Patescibacteria group bacterium]